MAKEFDLSKYDTTEKLLLFIKNNFGVEPMVYEMLESFTYKELVTYVNVKLNKVYK